MIGEREVATATLADAARVVQTAVERLLREGVLATPPTFFECATAIAFELFRRAPVDIAVLEVGLGGRLDATNVVTPIAAAITSIDFDHQDQLGDTIASIAREKAGVIKPGIPVVLGDLPVEASDVIQEVCDQRGAHALSAPQLVRVSSRAVDGDTIATLESARRVLPDVTLALRGRHQVANARIAVCLLDALTGLGVDVSDAAVRTGLTDARWPGRLERVRWRDADVLLDAAHNPAGARALAEYLRDAGWRDVTLVFGAMRDKDVDGMLAALLASCELVICTTASSPRARPAGICQRSWRASPPGAAASRPSTIPRRRWQRACRAGSRVVVTGSIFLIGPLRDILR